MGVGSNRKLTAADVAELTAFFQSSAPVNAVSVIQAQSYDAGTGGTYAPALDARLVRYVGDALRLSQSEWARTKRVIDQMLEVAGGDVHVRTLKLACSDPSAGWPEIACRTPTAMRAGRLGAERHEHMAALDGAYRAARERGLSPIAVAMRVLEADWRLLVGGVRVHEEIALGHARMMIAAGKVDLDAVTIETDAIVGAAAEALKTARAHVGQTRRDRQAAEDRRRAELRAQLRGERELRQAVRFDGGQLRRLRTGR